MARRSLGALGAWVLACSVAVGAGPAVAASAAGDSPAESPDVGECAYQFGMAAGRQDWTTMSDAGIADALGVGAATQADVNAWRILGERFVATWTTQLPEDQGGWRVVVGVRDLQNSEVAALKERLRSITHVPVEVANRDFSRAEFFDLTNRAMAAGGWVSNWIRPDAGLVIEEATVECLAPVREALLTATGKAPIEGAAADAAYAALMRPFGESEIAGWVPDDGQPAVLLRAGAPVNTAVGGGIAGGWVVESPPPANEGQVTPEVVTPETPAPEVAPPDRGAKQVTSAVASRVKISSTARVAASSRAKVKVTVKVPGVRAPEGKVTISWGKGAKVTTVTLKKSAKGTVTVRLPKLAKGKYKLTAHFVPADAHRVLGSASKVRGLRII
jgi:methionine-rich copper-binding protein CopC